MNSREAAMLLLPVLVLGVTSCSAPAPPQSDVLAVYPQPDYGMDALLEGTLREVDGCVLLELADDPLVVPVFPEGDAAWADDELTWKGKAFGVGETVRLGGGFAESDDASLPDGCRKHLSFLVSPY